MAVQEQTDGQITEAANARNRAAIASNPEMAAIQAQVNAIKARHSALGFFARLQMRRAAKRAAAAKAPHRR